MIRRLTVALSLLAFVSACGGSSPSTTTPAAITATAAVSIPVGAQSLGTSSYVPNPITISSGTQITWTNNDTIAHTSTSTDAGAVFDSGSIAPGGRFSFTFQNKGTFGYRCTFHAGMVGTVVVQ